MRRAEIEAAVVKLAAAQVSMDPGLVGLDARFHEDLNFDSLDYTEFVMELEERLSIDIPGRKRRSAGRSVTSWSW